MWCRTKKTSSGQQFVTSVLRGAVLPNLSSSLLALKSRICSPGGRDLPSQLPARAVAAWHLFPEPQPPVGFSSTKQLTKRISIVISSFQKCDNTNYYTFPVLSYQLVLVPTCLFDYLSLED